MFLIFFKFSFFFVDLFFLIFLCWQKKKNRKNKMKRNASKRDERHVQETFVTEGRGSKGKAELFTTVTSVMRDRVAPKEGDISRTNRLRIFRELCIDVESIDMVEVQTFTRFVEMSLSMGLPPRVVMQEHSVLTEPRYRHRSGKGSTFVSLHP